MTSIRKDSSRVHVIFERQYIVPRKMYFTSMNTIQNRIKKC